MLLNLRRSLSGFFCFLLLFSSRASAEDWRQDFRRALKNGGAIATEGVGPGKGTVLFEHRSDESFIPASTLKLTTVSAALKILGPEYRFKTDFYLSGTGDLYVKGRGDPTLVSEEIEKIAAALSQKVKSVRNIVLDDTYFAGTLQPDGSSETTNPYDSINGALVANFNTVFLRRRGKIIESAEPQTPLTDIARHAGERMQTNPERINIGKNRADSLRYFGELLTAFLEKSGVRTHGVTYRIAPVPAGTPLVYSHRSSQTLIEAARSLLEFSTNFTANQIFLILGAEQLGAPGTYEKGAKVVGDFLRHEVGWNDFTIVEGAGLSRQNRVTPNEMLRLLSYFKPNDDILPVENKKFHAKTGSLKGVGSLAGYMEPPGHGRVYFVIMVNDQVPFTYKFTLAEKLYEALTANGSR